MNKIILYGMPTCRQCRILKEYLKRKKIEFEYVDCIKQMDRAREIIKKSGYDKFPQMEIGNTIIKGMEMEQIRNALKGAKSEDKINETFK
jgi:glutaredoxin